MLRISYEIGLNLSEAKTIVVELELEFALTLDIN
jgi:hypothetical protein